MRRAGAQSTRRPDLRSQDDAFACSLSRWTRLSAGRFLLFDSLAK
jgi:hypothetical protein